MLPRFDLITTGQDGQNVLVCAVYAATVQQAFAVARRAGYQGTSLWSLGQYEVAATTAPFTLPPHLAWDVLTHRAQAFRRGQALCGLLRAHTDVMPRHTTMSSAALLKQLRIRPDTSDLRAHLEVDVRSAFPLQFMYGADGLWAAPQEQPARVRPALPAG